MTDQISPRSSKLPSGALVSAVARDHLADPKVRILESDGDVLYDVGYIPNAHKIDWHTGLNDQLQRDYISRER